MNKPRLFFALSTALMTLMTAQGQSLNVKTQGAVSYSYDAAKLGSVDFARRNLADGQLQRYASIEGLEFDLAQVELIDITEETLPDNTVAVNYDGQQAQVVIAGNVAHYVSAQVSGANVVIAQSDAASDTTCGEITYILSGTSSTGSFTMLGSYKASLVLNNLHLSSLSGAPLYIDNGKRIEIKAPAGTVNTLSDAPDGSHKGTIHCKGHLELKGQGSLTLTGNTAHALFAKEYIELKNMELIIPSAAKDGINCNQYFKMESGSVNIAAAGDDGIQVSYKDTENRAADDTGSLSISGGTLQITTAAKAAKALKAEGDIDISGGNLTLTVNGGGMWNTEKAKTQASSCISADGNIAISNGQLTMLATDGGGKGISGNSALTISGGELDIKTTGGMFVYSNGTENQNYTSSADRIATNNKSSAKGIKIDGPILISGGNFCISTATNGAEGIESKQTLTITGGTFNVKAYDDGMNSASTMSIEGGDLTVVSSVGDALDSNAGMIVAGGRVCVYGAGGMECGFDAATENGYTVSLTGGTILAAGGNNTAPTTTGTHQAYVTATGTLTANTTVSIKDGDTELATFIVPAYYGTTATPVMRGPGGGGNRPGTGSSGTILSAPGMQSGKSYTISIGSSTTTATAR